VGEGGGSGCGGRGGVPGGVTRLRALRSDKKAACHMQWPRNGCVRRGPLKWDSGGPHSLVSREPPMQPMTKPRDLCPLCSGTGHTLCCALTGVAARFAGKGNTQGIAAVRAPDQHHATHLCVRPLAQSPLLPTPSHCVCVCQPCVAAGPSTSPTPLVPLAATLKQRRMEQQQQGGALVGAHT